MKTTGSDALDNFKALEDRIARMLEKVGETRREKEALREKVHEAMGQIEALESEVRALRRERKTVRARVEALISLLERLEKEREEEIRKAAAGAAKDQRLVQA
jgi:chromosome segregation ATPase